MTPVKRKAPEGTGADAKATNQAQPAYDEEPTLRGRLEHFEASYAGVRWYLIDLARRHRGTECDCNGCRRWAA